MKKTVATKSKKSGSVTRPSNLSLDTNAKLMLAVLMEEESYSNRTAFITELIRKEWKSRGKPPLSEYLRKKD